MKKIFFVFAFITLLNAEGWLPRNTTQSISSSISYFNTTDNRNGLLIDLSYNFNTFTLGIKQSDSYELLKAELSAYVGYLLAELELALGCGKSSLYTGSTSTTDFFVYYAAKYYILDYFFLGAEQHLYQRTDAENFFLFHAGFTYTTD